MLNFYSWSPNRCTSKYFSKSTMRAEFLVVSIFSSLVLKFMNCHLLESNNNSRHHSGWLRRNNLPSTLLNPRHTSVRIEKVVMEDFLSGVFQQTDRINRTNSMVNVNQLIAYAIHRAIATR